MFNNSPTQKGKRTSPPGIPTQDQGAQKPHPDAALFATPDKSPRLEAFQPHMPFLQAAFLLLLSICLGSLGSFSLSPVLLPGLYPTPTPVPVHIIATATPTPTPIPPTPIAGSFIESECTAAPQDIKYLSGSQKPTTGPTPTAALPNQSTLPPSSTQQGQQGQPPLLPGASSTPSAGILTLPAAATPTVPATSPTATPPASPNYPTPPSQWALTGRSAKDYAYAQACAASFVVTYQTFDSAHLQTLEASTYMFTDGAKGRFYGTAPNTQPNQHMDPMWRAGIQKQSYQQSAQADTPNLLKVSTLNGRVLVWLTVPYQLSIRIGNSSPMLQSGQYTVLLMAVPINIQKTGTGWQVSQWVEGSAQFPPPQPL